MIAYSFSTPKDPDEKLVLNFDFSDDLNPGETLTDDTAPPVVNITLIKGTDSSPEAIMNGSAGFGPSRLNVLVPVQGGVGNPRCQYHVEVISDTTQGRRLVLAGLLTVVEF